MQVSNSDLLDYRLRLYRGQSTPIEFQLAVVEDLLRQNEVISGDPVLLKGYDEGYTDALASL